ncbi:RNA polymerase sigma factor [Capillimicrobium parvum]|nr:sigma-70 family RNA polymerase sigma factor [Capillimicrobium parvum]
MEAATLNPPVRACRGEPTDDDLVAATRAGDDRAFEALYARYQRRITAYVFGMVKDHGRAEDVTQEIFVSALRRMRRTDRPIAFKPWIYEIAKNACIDQFRRSRRAEEVSFDADDGVGPTLESSSPTPDAEVSARMEFDSLRSAFVGLTDTHHRILVMRELEGRTYAEIGDRLGMTRPAVESTLFRARKRLAEEYDELVTGERCKRVQAIIAATDAGRLGARDQRRMARHVSYCQPCRRAAALAGLADELPARTGVRAKVAGLLPLPAFLRDRWLGIGSHHVAAGGDAGGGAGALASWAHAAGPVLDAGGGGWFKAVATAATVAVAGVGANVVTSSGPQVDRAGDPAALAAAVSGGSSSGPASAPARRASAPVRTAAAVTRSASVVAPKASAPSRRTKRSGAAKGGAGGSPAKGSGSAGGGSSTGTSTGATGTAPAAAGSGGGIGSQPASGSGAGSGSSSTLNQAADQGKRIVSGSTSSPTTATPVTSTVPSTPSVPSAPALPSTDVSSLGDTQIQVPTANDVTQAVESTVTPVTGAVQDVTNKVGDAATGVTGGLLGG